MWQSAGQPTENSNSAQTFLVLTILNSLAQAIGLQQASLNQVLKTTCNIRIRFLHNAKLTISAIELHTKGCRH